MKKNLYLMLFAALIFALAGCGETAPDASTQNSADLSGNTELLFGTMEPVEKSGLFCFSYDEDTLWEQGDRVEFFTTWEYLGSESFSYGGPSKVSPTPKIYHNEDGSTEFREDSYELAVDVFSEDSIGSSQALIQPGAAATNSYRVKIPQDAPLGKYHLLLHFENYYQIFENAIEITESTKAALPNDGLFQFFLTGENHVWKRGEAVQTRAEMKYVGEELYPYYSSVVASPQIVVYYNADGSLDWTDQTYFVPTTGIIINASQMGIQPGESFVEGAGLTLPENAPLGKYHVKVSFLHYYEIFENAIEVVE